MSRLQGFCVIPPDEWYFQTHGDVTESKRRACLYLQAHGTYEGAEYEIEEFVRQWLLQQLTESYGYPSEWIGERIMIEEAVKMGSSEKQADISIKNTNRRTFLYLEAKKRGAPETEFAQAERQLESYLASTHTATIGMVSDGERVKVVRKKIDPNDFEYIPDLPAYRMDIKARPQLVREPLDAGDARETGLHVMDAQYERLLFDCHSIVRDSDGLHADEALDEICKVLYAKVFDERNTTKRPEGTPFQFQTYGASNPSEVASNIRSLYEEARNADIEVYAKRIPGYERSRGVFSSQIRLSDAALFGVVDRLQAFSLIDSRADIKGRAFQRILSTAIRSGMGQYFTPDPIVELAIEVLHPTAEDLILDPFCGSAHFLTKALRYVVECQGETLPPHALHEFKFFHLHGIEKSDRMVRIAMTDMLLHDDGHTNIRNQDALLSFDNYPDIIALRDDGKIDPAVFSIVVTNPPFGSIMKREVMEMIGRFELGHRRKALPLEILGLERSLQFLKPGGKLAIVLPEHLMKGRNNRFVRNWLYGVARVRAIFFLPEEAFTPFGAMVKTCLCVLQKLKHGEAASETDSTLLCDIENLGYDATGRHRAGSEVPAAVDEFRKNVRWS